MATLPPEIILDILSKLPVKSLCRFRCISKSCLALITDPRFVKMHLAQSRTLRLAASSASSLYSIDLEASHDHTLPAEDLEFPKYKKSCFLRLFGSCNGLLCVSLRRFDYEVFFLYNPSTREYKQILACKPNHRFYTIVGFGYAESIDDYKFVIKRTLIERSASVFSLRNNSWRNLRDDIPYKSLCVEQAGVPFNGAIHWVFMYNRDVIIAAFDLVEEKFKALPLPDHITSTMSYPVHVGVVGGCLCLYNKAYTDDIWVMQQYGVKESWTIKFSLAANPTGWPAKSVFQPLCCRKNSGMMFLASADNRKSVLRCRENDGTWMDFVVDCFQDNDLLFVQAYVESLVSPNCFSDSITQGSLEFSV